jgi:hypothetical protein
MSRKTTLDSEFDDPRNDERDAEIIAQEEKQAEQRQQIDDLIKQYGTDLKVRVWRSTSLSSKPKYLCTMEAADFQIETVAEAYGAGDYTIYFHDGKGRMIKGASIKFSIDPAAATRAIGSASSNTTNPADLVRATSEAMVQGKGDGNLVVEMLRQQAEQAQENNKLMMTMFMGMMTSMQQSNAQIIAAMAGRPVSAGESKVLESILPVLMERSFDKADQNSLPAVLDALSKFKAMAEGRNPDGEEKDDMMGGILKLLGPTMQMLAAASMPRTPAALPAVSIPVPAPQQPAPAPQQGNPAAVLDALCQLAAQNAPVEKGVEVLESQLTAAQMNQIVAIMEQDGGWFAQLAAIHPAAAPHKEWFERLRDYLLDTETDESEIEPNANSPSDPVD